MSHPIIMTVILIIISLNSLNRYSLKKKKFDLFCFLLFLALAIEVVLLHFKITTPNKLFG